MRPLATPAALLVAATLAGCPAGLFPNHPQAPGPGRADVVALAGPDLVVLEGAKVVLAGMASRALGGDPVLSWAQTDGPPVLLTNPSSALPAFVAPLAPVTLTFQLRAEAEGAVAFDTVNVVVESAPARSPVFLTVPGDSTAAPGSEHTFTVDAVGGDVDDVTLTATASCDAGAKVSVDGHAVTVTLPATLPCIVTVDGSTADGRGVAPASTVFWPADVVLPSATPSHFVVDGDGQPTTRFTPGHDESLALRFGDDPVRGSQGRAWAADGNPAVIPGGTTGDVGFAPPRQIGTLFVAGERRLGGKSGGVRYGLVEVTTAGTGNFAPVAHGGPDRIVKPGGRFKLDTSQSSDRNGDALTVSIAQVLGPTATADPVVAGVYAAPVPDDGADVTLLFHVVADDGTVLSPPDPVRVLVSSGADNVGPVLDLPTSRFVVPDQVFLVDASGAEDPDSGVIASYSITQSSDDAVVLLPAPSTAATVELTAGAAGDVYHFEITAFDEDGLGATVDQTITVEDAGPFVDPDRGDDATGNGTVARPFATVAGALPTALRHELPELLLAEGTHAPIAATLPDGLSLRGAQHFDGAQYVDGGAESVLPVGQAGANAGLVVNGAHLADLTVVLQAGSLVIEGTSALDTVKVEETPQHAASLVVVDSGAAATITDSTVEPFAAHDDASVRLAAGASATFAGGAVVGAPGASAVGISCAGAALALDHTSVTGGAGADASVGVDAQPGCVLDVTAANITGGDGGDAVGVGANDTLVTVDVDSVITGASGAASSGTALRLSGRDRSAVVHGTLRAGALAVPLDAGFALDAVDAQVSLQGATLTAAGAGSTAARMSGGVLVMNDAIVDAGDVGVALDGAVDAQLTATHVTAVTALSSTSNEPLTVDGSTLTAVAGGVSAAAAPVTLSGTTVSVSGSGAVLGVDALSAIVEDCGVEVEGDDAIALRAGDGATVDRSSFAASGSASAVGVAAAGAVSLQSVFVAVTGGDGVDAPGGLTLRHATVVADAAALRLESGATLDAANSVLAGVPGLVAADKAPWTRASALAFDAGSTFVVTSEGSTTTANQLVDGLGCAACLVVDVGALVDGTGHLAAGANPLVDAADPSLSLPDDIDGDTRPQGPGPDIGCDERLP